MKYRSLNTLFALTLLFALSLPQHCLAGLASGTIREATEIVLRKFGKEVAEESVESVTKQVAKAGAEFGTEGLEAIGKVGPRVFQKITVEAGEHAPGVVKLTAKFGDEAVWVVSKPRGMAIFVKYGDEAATAVMKHPGVAEGAIENLGVPAAKALNAVTGQQARRLGMLINDGTVKAGEQSAGLLNVVAKFGDKAMEFIWKNKGALFVAATLTAFLNNPEPFIQGTKDLITDAVVPIGKEIAQRTNWTPVFIVGLAICAGLIALRMFFRKRRGKYGA